MNSFSAQFNFQVFIIDCIACFKNNDFCFCYIEWNFISIKPKKLSRVFIANLVNDTFVVLDV